MLISHRNTEKSVWPDTGFRVAQAAQARRHKISPDTGSLWVPGLCEGLQNDFVKHDVDRQNEHRHGAGPGERSGALGRSRERQRARQLHRLLGGRKGDLWRQGLAKPVCGCAFV